VPEQAEGVLKGERVEGRAPGDVPAQVGPIAKGLCGPGLLAHVVTAKFADHTPVHRLAGQLARSGVTIASSTLGDWLFRASELLTPLYDLMQERLLLSRVIHGDDTGVKLRVPGSNRTKKAHLWTYIGDADYPYVLFDFTAGYTADGPTQFLEGYKGYFQADALAQYEGLYGEDKVKHVCCVAHARRKFVAASDAGDGRAAKALELFGRLYAVERALPPLLPPPIILPVLSVKAARRIPTKRVTKTSTPSPVRPSHCRSRCRSTRARTLLTPRSSPLWRRYWCCRSQA